jgi:hypothetical protein
MSQHNLPQIQFSLAVKKNAAPSKNEEIEILDFEAHFTTIEISYRNGLRNPMSLEGVLGVSGKDRNLYRQGVAKLVNDRAEYGLISQIQASVGA